MVARVVEQDGHLLMHFGREGRAADLRQHLVPLGEHRFGVGRYEGGRLVGIDPAGAVTFALADGVVTGITAEYEGRVELRATRVVGPR